MLLLIMWNLKQWYKWTYLKKQKKSQRHRKQIRLLLLLLLSHFNRVWLCATRRGQPTRLPHPWESPGKNTGVGCHFLLQCMKLKSEREVAQSCPTLSDPTDCSLSGSSIHGIFQEKVNMATRGQGKDNLGDWVWYIYVTIHKIDKL